MTMPTVCLFIIICNLTNKMQLVSCSVVVREDKKLLTVLFPDGRDGRAFTLKVTFFVIFLFKTYSNI